MPLIGETDNILSGCGDRIVSMHNSQNGIIRTFNGDDPWLYCGDELRRKKWLDSDRAAFKCDNGSNRDAERKVA